MKFTCLPSGKTITSLHRLGQGGEATVYSVLNHRHLALKLFHNPTEELRRKLSEMIANPPDDPEKINGHVSIAWPLEIVMDEAGRFAGYLMPLIENSFLFAIIYHPGDRKRNHPGFTYPYLIRTAANLAGAVAAIHRKGFVIGDLNESNILVQATALVTIIDTDSFQIGSHLCLCGKPEYTAPEMHGKSTYKTRRKPEQDWFALAILIHQLIMNGVHPFCGVGNPSNLMECIQKGLSPYNPDKRIKQPPYAISSDFLPNHIQELFVAAFVAGHGNPAKRPSAEEWRRALLKAEHGLIQCRRNPMHFHFNSNSQCSWCAREKNNQGEQRPLPAANMKPAVTIKHPRQTYNPPIGPPFPTNPSHRNPSGVVKFVFVIIAACICLFLIQDFRKPLELYFRDLKTSFNLKRADSILNNHFLSGVPQKTVAEKNKNITLHSRKNDPGFSSPATKNYQYGIGSRMYKENLGP